MESCLDMEPPATNRMLVKDLDDPLAVLAERRLNNALVVKLQTLGPLSDEDRTFLERCTTNAKRCAAKSDIAYKSELSSRRIVILQGTAAQYQSFSDGKRQIVGFLLPGDFCDYEKYAGEEPNYYIMAITNVRYVDLDTGVLEKISEIPSLSEAFMLYNAASTNILRTWMTNIGQQKAYNRTAHLLCEMYYRFRSINLVVNHSFDIGANQNELGFALGLTSVHVNRSLKELRKANLIDLRKGSIKILNLAELMEVGAFKPNYLLLACEKQMALPSTGAFHRL